MYNVLRMLLSSSTRDEDEGAAPAAAAEVDDIATPLPASKFINKLAILLHSVPL
jgi:hypothetical protein